MAGGRNISLHGACAETHDRQTRIPGSFSRLMENLKTMQGLGLRIKLNSALTAWNEGEIERMFALAGEFGLRLSVDIRVTPRDDGDLTPLDISASVEGIRIVLRLQKEQAESRVQAKNEPEEKSKTESRHHCGAGSSTLTVDPVGNVYPCVQWRRAVGNLHTERVQELWNGSAGLAQVRDVTAQVKDNFRDLDDGGRKLGFCPALAEQRTGNPLIFDPEIGKYLRVLATGD